MRNHSYFGRRFRGRLERRHHEEGWEGHEMRWERHAPRRERFWFGPGRRGPGGPGGPPWGGPEGPGGPGGPPWGDEEDRLIFFGGPPRRQRRGDMRFALLELLAEQPRHGYELIKELERRFGGFYRPSPGSVYPTLQLLEDEGHLSSASVEGKRVYTITESGKTLLAERPEGPRGPGERMREQHRRRDDLDRLRQGVEALMGGVQQAGRHGTAEQVQAVAAILERARREIYAALATPGAEPSEGNTERLDP